MNLIGFRRRSKGWEKDPPAYIHSRILFGPGMYLDEAFVKLHGITHVINCAFDTDSPQWFRSQNPTKYKCLNSVDSLNVNILDWYSEFEKTLHAFLREEGSKNVYIHCQCGINRSGFLVLAFMCKRLNIDFNTAIKTILDQRPCALSNPTYMQQVYRFSEQKG
jgi:protein-tyrosine phosphatase